MSMQTLPFDPAEHLKTGEDVALYLDAALEDGDPAVIRTAIGVAARVRGMAHVARQAGLSREGLHRALSAEGDPEFVTVVRVLKALGVRLSTAAAAQPKA